MTIRTPRPIHRLIAGAACVACGLAAAPVRGEEGPVEPVLAEPIERELPAVEEAEFAVEAAGDAAENYDELQPYLQHLGHLLTVEMHFLRKVCRPSAEEVATIRQAGAKQLPEIARWMRQCDTNDLSWSTDPPARVRLTEALLAVTSEVLSADQAAVYRREIEARRTARAQAAAEMLTIHIDQTVTFSEAQAQAVPQVIIEGSRPHWDRNLFAFLVEEYAPLPGIEVLAPVLDDRQQKLWYAEGLEDREILSDWETEIGVGVFETTLQELDDYSSQAQP